MASDPGDRICFCVGEEVGSRDSYRRAARDGCEGASLDEGDKFLMENQSRRSRNNQLTGFFPSKQPYCLPNKSPAGSGCTSTQSIQPRMEMNMCAISCKQLKYCISCLSGLSTTESKYPGLKVAVVGETTLSCDSDCDDVWFCPQHTNTVICR